MSSGGYGSQARVGIGPPQANPTVEPEIAALLPDDVAMYVSRLTSKQPAAQDRLVEYLEHLDVTLDRFDTLKLDAYGFACTGSTYLLGTEEEQRIVGRLSEARGYPIITCAMAIVDALKFLGAETLAIYSPYPSWLHDASTNYWRNQGFQILVTQTINAKAGDTREIYAQDPRDVATLMLESDPGADVSLITGTGLPSLELINQVAEASNRTVLSSNLCLAWRLLKEVGAWTPTSAAPPGYPLLTGWQHR
jgi:maleate isomerase